MKTNIRIIGLDWATEDARRAVAAVDVQGDRAALVHLERCSRRKPALTIVGDLLANSDQALLAIDAPLGWPVGMRTGLETHVAGQLVCVGPAEMFARATDRLVRERLKYRPMEVGANLIARVAHSALVFLDQLRKTSRRPIPLLWSATVARQSRSIRRRPSASVAALHRQKSYRSICRRISTETNTCATRSGAQWRGCISSGTSAKRPAI